MPQAQIQPVAGDRQWRWKNFVKVKTQAQPGRQGILRDLGAEWAAMSEEQKDLYIVDNAPARRNREESAAEQGSIGPPPMPADRSPFGFGDDDHVISLERLEADVRFRTVIYMLSVVDTILGSTPHHPGLLSIFIHFPHLMEQSTMLSRKTSLRKLSIT